MHDLLIRACQSIILQPEGLCYSNGPFANERNRDPKKVIIHTKRCENVELCQLRHYFPIARCYIGNNEKYFDRHNIIIL